MAVSEYYEATSDGQSLYLHILNIGVRGDYWVK